MRLRSFVVGAFASVLVAGWLVPPAVAADREGQSLPDTFELDGRPLLLNGIGLRTLTFLRVRAYIAGLYLAHPTHDSQQILASPEPKVIVLKFIHGASKERVEKQYRAGEAENCGSGGCDPADEGDFEHLVAVAPAVKPGDTTTYVIQSPQVRVFANGRLIDEFKNRDLAYQLLSGFIGDHPPSAAMRREMLGLPPD